mgnify:CR=1 FL=1
MINVISGDMFQGNHEAIVNPINCVGIIGKGIAAQCKQLYPKMFEEYQGLCLLRKLSPGNVWYYKTEVDQPKYILNLATKDHWRDPSELDWIVTGCKHLVQVLMTKWITNVGIPSIGCGNGKLDWNIVKPYLIEILDSNLWLKEWCNITIYEPQ